MAVMSTLEAGTAVVASERDGVADRICSSGYEVACSEQESGGLAAALTAVHSSGDALRDRACAMWRESLNVDAWVAAIIRTYGETGARL